MERRVKAMRDLEAALEERDIAQERFEAAIGTGTEMRAYQRVRAATRRVAAADAAARRAAADEEQLLRA